MLGTSSLYKQMLQLLLSLMKNHLISMECYTSGLHSSHNEPNMIFAEMYVGGGGGNQFVKEVQLRKKLDEREEEVTLLTSTEKAGEDVLRSFLLVLPLT